MAISTRRVCAALALALLSLAPAAKRVPVGTPTPRPEGSEWVDLFDSEHAKEWRARNDAPNAFEWVDGTLHVLQARPPSDIGYLKEKFGDFQAHMEIKVTSEAECAVVFRAQWDTRPLQGLGIAMHDDYGEVPDVHTTGALVGVATPMLNLSRPAGEWNSLDVTCKGKKLEVAVNGWKVLDLDLSPMTMQIGRSMVPCNDLPLEGIMAIQNHGCEVWIKNCVVKRL